MRDVQILKLFHDQKGKTVGVAALKDFCWMMQSPEEAKAVDWNINHLRKKVEGDPANPVLISTVEGGYRYG
jgi:DNA-binding response OmpR family regulator